MAAGLPMLRNTQTTTTFTGPSHIGIQDSLVIGQSCYLRVARCQQRRGNDTTIAYDMQLLQQKVCVCSENCKFSRNEIGCMIFQSEGGASIAC
ncbi:hypothetical protein CEXT_642821 [Caerostris extrusa]|uniref:Uncharacterized protein n=1 Tax=Caerostris extrusa TaxID=172846 RepID=A0AAV4WQX9_CAEEX|nr:hypothetical protein CEXT_642821 [Caerostris extrusa]